MDGIDETTRTELEAAVFRRLVSHLQGRTDVQNIELDHLTFVVIHCRAHLISHAPKLCESRGVVLIVTKN